MKKTRRSGTPTTRGRALSPADQPTLGWSLQVPAHTSTWAFLGRFENLKPAFPGSVGVKLKSLAYWSEAPDATNDTAANDLALRLDQHFARRMLVPYESSHNMAKARQALFAIVRDGENTVGDLAQAVDEVFDFFGESA